MEMKLIFTAAFHKVTHTSKGWNNLELLQDDSVH